MTNFSKLLMACAICTILGCGISFFLVQKFYLNQPPEPAVLAVNNVQQNCGFRKITAKYYKFIKPILMIEQNCESKELQPLKTLLNNAINQLQSQKNISNASIFVIDLNRSNWIGINEQESYSPGSLIKVPLAICIMKMVEDKKCLLTDKITAPLQSSVPVKQTYNAESIQPGATYTIEELLKYSLAYSDNNATQLLNLKVDLNYFKKLFEDISLAAPDVHDVNYTINPKDYSRFARILFNGTYLYKRHSEQLLEMMSHSSFQAGIAASIDRNRAYMSSKFGESFMNGEHQLHETGIIYVNNSAYLITIMTKGKQVGNLSTAIQSLAKLAYDQMTAGGLPTSVARL